MTRVLALVLLALVAFGEHSMVRAQGRGFPRDARQRDVGALHDLRVAKLDRLASLERSPLPEPQRDEPRFRRRDLPASRWKIAELESSLSVRAREARAARVA